MTFAANGLLAPKSIDPHDSVRVPDGRVGEVIGFYRREHESVVVLFPGGWSGEFPSSSVTRCR